MKKIVSLLAVALFAMTFAAGCGKPTKCKEATKEADCKADFFDKEKDDKGNCHWVKDANDAAKGNCEVKPAPYTETDADKKVCSDVKTPATAAACTAVDANLSKEAKAEHYKCTFTDATTPCKLGK